MYDAVIILMAVILTFVITIVTLKAKNRRKK